MEAGNSYVTWPQMNAELARVQTHEAAARQTMQDSITDLSTVVGEYVQIAKADRERDKEKAQKREKWGTRLWALCVVVVAAVLAVATPSAIHAIFGVVGA